MILRSLQCTSIIRTGMALANVVKSLEYGITTFDSSCGGLGDVHMHQEHQVMLQLMT